TSGWAPKVARRRRLSHRRTTVMKHKTFSRTTKGRFKKGVSGNSAGRPIGSRNKTTVACEQMLDGEGEELIRIAVKSAKQGNIHALRLCLERIVPPRKERCINLELRPIVRTGSLPKGNREA